MDIRATCPAVIRPPPPYRVSHRKWETLEMLLISCLISVVLVWHIQGVSHIPISLLIFIYFLDSSIASLHNPLQLIWLRSCSDALANLHLATFRFCWGEIHKLKQRKRCWYNNDQTAFGYIHEMNKLSISAWKKKEIRLSFTTHYFTVSMIGRFEFKFAKLVNTVSAVNGAKSHSHQAISCSER